MARSAKALINPKMLKWARERSGFTVDKAVPKLRQKPEIILQWEAGEKAPTFKQLLIIAKLYKRPVPLFYLAEPPKNFKPLHDYRRQPGIASVNKSPQLNYEIRKAYSRRQIALELFAELGEQIPPLAYKITLSDKPESIGDKLRSWLGIDDTSQARWKTKHHAFNGWRHAIEESGILVFQASHIEVAEMRGFAICERPLPVIAINKRDIIQGRIFSMLHELAHILLGNSSISVEKEYSPQKDHVEIFCNSVAASALMPARWFETNKLLSQFIRPEKQNDETVKTAARNFGVSQDFIWRRLLTMGFITRQTYQQKHDALIREYQDLKSQKKNEPVRTPYYKKVISSTGNFYTRLVLSSYHMEKISSSTASEYLDIKLKHLPKIEKELFGASVWPA